VLRTNGSERFDVAVEGAPADAERLGREAGRDLKCRLPEGVLVKGG
jgi:hydroxymethylbilane synthase